MSFSCCIPKHFTGYENQADCMTFDELTQVIRVFSSLQAGISDVELVEHIREGNDQKPERHEFLEAPERLLRVMSRTGG